MSELEFAAVLARARSGDSEAFAQLYRDHAAPLLRYLRGLGGADASEDLAAETWLAVVRDLASFTGDEAAFRGWLFTIGRHRLLDARRAQGRRPVTTVADHAELELRERVGAPDVADLVLERADTQAALEMVATLPPDQAEAVLLRVVAGLEVAQVAEVMERTPGAVRVLTHRGLKTLAQRFTQTAQRQL